ncbi:MAG TPA: RDD family protein [Methanocella sp.]|jgi:uncharacterized RDD family membrane protein YckC/membrane protease YdiL (CAAX protease family)
MEFTKDARQDIEDWLRQVRGQMTMPAKDLEEIENELRSGIYERSESMAAERGSGTVIREDVKRVCAEERAPDEIAACYTRTYVACLKRAGFWCKTVAYLVDFAITFVAFAVVFAIIMTIYEVFYHSPLLDSPAYMAAFIGIPFCYFIAMEGCFGTTIGKYVTGLKVLKTDGTRIGFREAILRNITTNPWLGVLAIDVLVMLLFFGKEKQRAFDRIAGTMVVSMWSPAKIGALRSRKPSRDEPARAWTPDGSVSQKPSGRLSGHLKVATKITLLFLTILVALTIMVIPIWLAFGAYEMAVTGSGMMSLDALAKSTSLPVLTVDMVVQCIVFVAAVLLFMAIIDRQPILPKERIGWLFVRTFMWFFAGGLLYAVLAIIVLAFMLGTGMTALQMNGLSTYTPTTLAYSLALTLMIAISAAIGNELVFRKYIQGYLMGNYSTAVAVLIPSILLTILYIIAPIPGQASQGPLYYISLFALSLLLGYLYAAAGSVWACVGCHFVFMAALFNLPQAGQEIAGVSPLALFSVAGDLVLFNVNLGSQAYLAGTVACLAVMAGLYVYDKKFRTPRSEVA